MRIILSFIFVMINLTIFAQADVGLPASQKQWTFAVYVNGDNNLDNDLAQDVIEMQKIGSTDKVNVVVYRDTKFRDESTKIYSIEKGKKTIVHDYGSNIDSGDYRSFVDFAKFAITNFPSEKFALIVSTHGGGWKSQGGVAASVSRNRSSVFKGISGDDYSGNYIKTAEMGESLRQISAFRGSKVDIFGLDSCLMQMAEVLFEYRDAVKISVGSEAEVPSFGWQYEKILGLMNSMTNSDSESEVSKMIVEQNQIAYSRGGTYGLANVHFSAIDVDKFVGSMNSLSRFAEYLTKMSPKFKNELITSDKKVVTIVYADQTGFDYIDLIDYVDQIDASIGVKDASARNLASELRSNLQASVVSTKFSGDFFSKTKGISIWLPDKYTFSAKSAAYKALSFAKNSSWDEFLSQFIKTTSTSQSQGQSQ